MKTTDTRLKGKLNAIAQTSEKLRATGWPDRRELRPALGTRVLSTPMPKGGK